MKSGSFRKGKFVASPPRTSCRSAGKPRTSAQRCIGRARARLHISVSRLPTKPSSTTSWLRTSRADSTPTRVLTLPRTKMVKDPM